MNWNWVDRLSKATRLNRLDLDGLLRSYLLDQCRMDSSTAFLLFIPRIDLPRALHAFLHSKMHDRSSGSYDFKSARAKLDLVAVVERMEQLGAVQAICSYEGTSFPVRLALPPRVGAKWQDDRVSIDETDGGQQQFRAFRCGRHPDIPEAAPVPRSFQGSASSISLFLALRRGQWPTMYVVGELA